MLRFSLFPAGVNLSKNPGDTVDSLMLFLARKYIDPVRQSSGPSLTNDGEDFQKKRKE